MFSTSLWLFLDLRFRRQELWTLKYLSIKKKRCPHTHTPRKNKKNTFCHVFLLVSHLTPSSWRFHLWNDFASAPAATWRLVQWEYKSLRSQQGLGLAHGTLSGSFRFLPKPRCLDRIELLLGLHFHEKCTSPIFHLPASGRVPYLLQKCCSCSWGQWGFPPSRS